MEEISKIPDFVIEPEKGLFEVSGRSYPENTIEVYGQLLESIKEYVQNPQPETSFNIKLELCATGSTKTLVYIFQQLDRMVAEKENVSVSINWYVLHDDEDDLQMAEDMKDGVKEADFHIFLAYNK